MPRTSRVFDMIERLPVEMEYVESLLNSRSEVEATCAYSHLRAVLTEPEVVALANLREVLAEIPETPFMTAEPLDVLVEKCGFERSERSYRRLYDTGLGVFGIEFRGDHSLCERIVVHTADGACVTTGGDVDCIVDPCVLHAAFTHHALIDEIVGALNMLGVGPEPRVYLVAEDFSAAHAAGAATEMLGGLF